MAYAEMSKASVLFYKVYHLDKAGNIKSSTLVQAWNDADALEKAGGLGSDHEIEVWDRTRFVGVASSASGAIGGKVSVASSELLETTV